MMDKLSELKRWVLKKNKMDTSALNIKDKKLINSFIEQPDFPWFISFPRTGSHWVRMLMELYFEMPSLVEIYYYKNAKDFTCYHRHDLDLQISGCKNVVYLYRDPVDTIFSQMSYEKINLDDRKEVDKWAKTYGMHLSKWLLDESFTTKKTILTYENMKNSTDKEFMKICEHFGVEFNQEKLMDISKLVTKEDLKKRTSHDVKVVNLTNKYKYDRQLFRKKYSESIIDIITNYNSGLLDVFNRHEIN